MRFKELIRSCEARVNEIAEIEEWLEWIVEGDTERYTFSDSSRDVIRKAVIHDRPFSLIAYVREESIFIYIVAEVTHITESTMDQYDSIYIRRFSDSTVDRESNEAVMEPTERCQFTLSSEEIRDIVETALDLVSIYEGSDSIKSPAYDRAQRVIRRFESVERSECNE